MDKIVFCFGMLVVVALSTLLHGWTISWLYTWFVADPFNVARLSVLHCIGLSVMARYICGTTSDNVKGKKLGELIGMAFGAPFIVLAVC